MTRLLALALCARAARDLRARYGRVDNPRDVAGRVLNPMPYADARAAFPIVTAASRAVIRQARAVDQLGRERLPRSITTRQSLATARAHLQSPHSPRPAA